MRQLRGEGDGAVLLVYPSTIDEYWKAIDALERPAAPTADGGPEARRSERRPGPGPCHVVTTAAQRDRWGLPDLGASLASLTNSRTKGVWMIAVHAGSVSSSSGQSTTSTIAHHVLGVEESAAGSACTWGRSGHTTWRPWKLMFGATHEGAGRREHADAEPPPRLDAHGVLQEVRLFGLPAVDRDGQRVMVAARRWLLRACAGNLPT